MAAHTVTKSIGIQFIMSDLFIADCNGAVVAGYYSKDKMTSYVTGYAIRDQGDDAVQPFLVGFNKDIPIGSLIHVHTNKDLGFGLDYDYPLEAEQITMYDLTGQNVGFGVPRIKLAKGNYGSNWYIKDIYKYNGTYDFTISYNGQSKHFTMIINAQKED